MGGRSGHVYTLTPQPDGTTEVEVVIIREPKTFKGRALGALLQLGGKGLIARAFAQTLKAIEARVGTMPPDAG